MFFKKTLLLVATISLTASFLNAQSNNQLKSMTEKIDSLTKANGIEIAEVIFNEVTSSFDKTATSKTTVSLASKFKFDGQFLVFDNKYFNLNKLLYFEINTKKKKIIFCFQGY